MCFSATASFAAAGLLTAISFISIKKASSRSLQLFAATPLIFAIQQASEGIIWLADPASWINLAATYIFLFFAGIFWPVWIPSVLYHNEQNSMRKKIMLAPLFCGLFIAVGVLISLAYYGAQSHILNHHVAYTFTMPQQIQFIAHIMYLIAVIAPCFIASMHRIWLLGVGIIGAYWLSMLWQSYHFASIWCFFAALLSSLVLYIVLSNRGGR